MLNKMATSLFEHGGLVTTTAKAKELRPFAEELITLARRGDLHARRLVEQKIKDREVVGRLFKEIGPRFAGEFMDTLPMRLDWLWFLGYDLDTEVSNHSVLSKARARWGVEAFRNFFERVV